jgi:hypothetical protein
VSERESASRTHTTPRSLSSNRSKTIYNDASIRAFNILIEASDRKIPLGDELGSSKGLLTVPKDAHTPGGALERRRSAMPCRALPCHAVPLTK